MNDELTNLFRGLHSRDQEEFSALGEPVAFDTGDVILPAGRSEWDVYIVQEGEVSIWIGNTRIRDLQVGQIIGTAAILSPQIQWSAVKSNSSSVLLRITREAVLAFFEKRPERVFQQFCVNVFKEWVEVLRQRNRRIAEVQGTLLQTARPRTRERHSILVADDEQDLREVMVEFFGTRYDMLQAGDGVEAVECALAQRPDLILLDLRMPGLDGYEVCRRLKSHPVAGSIPIVMLTALRATPDKVKGLMYGADEYLTKPVDFEHLDEVIGRILQKVYR